MVVSLWVNHRWRLIANTRSNVSLCLFNLTVPSQSTRFSPILYTKESVTKALNLLFTAVHGLPYWLRNHIISSRFIIKQAAKLRVRVCKQYRHTALYSTELLAIASYMAVWHIAVALILNFHCVFYCQIQLPWKLCAASLVARPFTMIISTFMDKYYCLHSSQGTQYSGHYEL